jgi:hypothetical protein
LEPGKDEEEIEGLTEAAETHLRLVRKRAV